MSVTSSSKTVVRPFRNVAALSPRDEAFQTWFKTRQGKLCIELGCGAGMHPLQFAEAHPDASLVAIERTKNKSELFSNALQDRHLPNLFPVNADALYWLPGNIEPTSIDQFFILYPNPYPKERQANKRWHRNPLMHFIMECLKPDGILEVATNEDWYLEECKFYMLRNWDMAVIEERVLSIEDHKPRTHFEKKYLERDVKCRNLVFQRAGTIG